MVWNVIVGVARREKKRWKQQMCLSEPDLLMELIVDWYDSCFFLLN